MLRYHYKPLQFVFFGNGDEYSFQNCIRIIFSAGLLEIPVPESIVRFQTALHQEAKMIVLRSSKLCLSARFVCHLGDLKSVILEATNINSQTRPGHFRMFINCFQID